MLGEKWKTLSEKQRQPYEAKAAADKKRYEEEKTAYAASLVRIPLSLPNAFLTFSRPMLRTTRTSLSKSTLTVHLLSHATCCELV